MRHTDSTIIGPLRTTLFLLTPRRRLSSPKLKGSHVLSIRPTIAEHSLYVFGRSIHPELFHIFKTKHIQRSNYSARIDITGDGHVITFVHGHLVISEVVCSCKQLLPQKRRYVSSPLRSKFKKQVDRNSVLKYSTECERESVSPEMFWMLQTQLQRVDCENELIQNFDSSGRIAFGAVSYLHVEERESQLLVKAFHTFPDGHTILKAVSTFQTC